MGKAALTGALLAVAALAACGGDSTAPQPPEPPVAAALCPASGEDVNEANIREAAQDALVGLPLRNAEGRAEDAGCHLAPTSIDGEPQILTREYDPTRIQVEVRSGKVQQVVGFG